MTETNELIELKGSIKQVAEAVDAMRDINQKVEKGSATKLDIAEFEKFKAEFTEVKSNIDAMRAIAGAPNKEEKSEDAEIETKAFNDFMRKGIESKALVSASDVDGGFTLPAPALQLIKTRIFETSPFRQYASVVTISGDRWEGVLDNDEAGASWSGSETATVSESDTPQVGKKTIYAHELVAEPRATQIMLDDSAFDLQAWLSAKVADKFARSENNSFLLGTGVGQPKGIVTSGGTAKALSAADAYSASEVEVYKSGTSGAFGSDSKVAAQNVLKLMSKLKSEYRSNAICFGSRSAELELMLLQDGQGQFLFKFDNDGVMRIKGVPFVAFNDMAAVGADSTSFGFGDLRQAYQIVDRKGVTVLRDPFTSKPYVKFYTTKRVGGDVVNYEAVKLLKLSA